MDTSAAKLFIDGEFRDARRDRRFDVLNPFNEQVIGSAADADPDDVGLAVGAARRAFDQTRWSTDHSFRKKCLLQLQAALRENLNLIHHTVLSEAGVCRRYLPFHIDDVLAEISWFAELAESFEWERDLPVHRMGAYRSHRHVRYEPFGVIAAITPWNAPFVTKIVKTMHALATGNTLVLKSASDTPLTGMIIAQAIAEHTDVPAGVFNLLSSGSKAEAGEALTADPRVDLFHFTGSPATGQRIAERAAIGFRKAVLELGGKSANIILDDANLDEALPVGVARCMSTSGQGCMLPTRMVIHESRFEEAVERLTEIVGAVKWGDPNDPDTSVGPIIRADQVTRIGGIVDRARAEGCSVRVGGTAGRDGRAGYWYSPTLVVAPGEMVEIAQTEVFGPVLTVMRYDGDDEEAIRIANATPYGLSGYVQTRTPERAWHIANRLRTGSVAIGASTPLGPDSPFGGYGMSGQGREYGLEGFRECLQVKTISTPAS